MEQFLIWILIAYGMTSVIVWGSIFQGLRDWVSEHSKFFGDLVSCTLCTATWVGFFLSLTLGGLTSTYFNIDWKVSIFFDGMFTAGAVWALNSLIEFFEENRFK